MASSNFSRRAQHSAQVAESFGRCRILLYVPAVNRLGTRVVAALEGLASLEQQILPGGREQSARKHKVEHQRVLYAGEGSGRTQEYGRR